MVAQQPQTDAQPFTGLGMNTEPMLLLDTTGSMNRPTGPGTNTPRHRTVQEAMGLLVAALGKEDAQAAHEAGGGGLRTITFADGQARDLEDLNPGNLRHKWAGITWAGGTYIMPGWGMMMRVYNEEFGNEPNPPTLIALIVTDGELEDAAPFTQTLERATSQAGARVQIYTVIALLGFGPEHDRARAAYEEIAGHNTHVRLVNVGAETDPQTIADTLLRMIA